MKNKASSVAVLSAAFGTELVDVDELPARIRKARQRYKLASERLFELCCSVQLTGQLPDRELLSQAMVEFQNARNVRDSLEALQHSIAAISTAAPVPPE